MKGRKPLIDLLASRYPDSDREQLWALLACRNVRVDGEICTDGKRLFLPTVHLSLSFGKYVSRGGYKLEHALDAFSLDVAGKVMLDAGASTGGFTDCLLQRGARIVHSVDVGTNQLDWKLRTDSRVVVHEKQNIMHLEKPALVPLPDGAVCDLSFRSIAGAAGHILSLVREEWICALVKPQFEVPKGLAGFHGVITDPATLQETMVSVYRALREDGVAVKDVVKSPITGHKGNTEYLALLGRDGDVGEEEFTRRLALER